MACALYAFGSNGNGQLGIGSNEDMSIPQPVLFAPSLSFHTRWQQEEHREQYEQGQRGECQGHDHAANSPFIDFAAGGNHTAIITRGNQTLYMTGSNKDCETLLSEASQVFSLHANRTAFPSGEGEEEEESEEQWGDKTRHKDRYQHQNQQRWRSIACGWAFTIAVTEPGYFESKLVNGANDDIEGTIANEKKATSKVFAWGSGSFGELGLGPHLTKSGRKAIEIETGLLNKNSNSYPLEILKVKAGLRHVLLLAKEEKTAMQGDQSINSNNSRKSKTFLVGWGSNRQGQLGILERPSNTDVVGDVQPSSLSFTEKELRGKFMEPTRILISKLSVPEVEILDMACGQNHSLVLFSDGTVYASGLNKYGQLGPSSSSASPSASSLSSVLGKDFRIGFECVHGLPYVDSISCGWNHNAAMDTRPFTQGGSSCIYLWGRDDHGQLGSGRPYFSVNVNLSGTSQVIPSSIIVQVRIPTSRSTPTLDNAQNREDTCEEIVSYSCGSEHTLAMTRSGDCYAWGWNEHGNCGTGSIEDLCDVLEPRKIALPGSNNSSNSRVKHGLSRGWVKGGYGSSWVWI
ncbi:hypothetical protein BX616_009846 [Lobosporangium transversale]|uniref:Regulator of chromosome condensation 1/beta-lactamase-inhibitor protein II n=1 Tax=Lobosporangium transversale TaxID=64571 RepID=A0A1Y2GLW5_9FUNG|nr:regulator of chromosome condensation 1/beta-lactamase-inhibitor protein II [Lobosporangium transversale]KAF9913595.1 hypothetical protein BX616_009846 [Lobosporangium transversale]ORZ11303.1 regulator of chromosome condensation 1/beta-lactamase-inhibitor protein II [Lobosporangium transversale]|eukprot:XP_021879618.1 regulator of chromosome condensation 1/beta-lactamase-inhibitor protein II [Lobosporangium transversale]